MNLHSPPEDSRAKLRVRAVLQILWPGFFAAAVLIGLLFSVVDPLSLELVREQLNNSREATYTLAFLITWIITSSACATTRLLSVS